MSNILIISATSKNNLKLAEKINKIAKEEYSNVEIINVEQFHIPLFTPNEYKVGIPSDIEPLTKKFQSANAFIFCAPEYNGSIPPIISNLIAWISVSTDQWREVFNGKAGLIATYSAGNGQNFLRSMRIQMEHLGVIVLPRTIVVSNQVEFNSDSCRNKIKQLVRLINH